MLYHIFVAAVTIVESALIRWCKARSSSLQIKERKRWWKKYVGRAKNRESHRREQQSGAAKTEPTYCSALWCRLNMISSVRPSTSFSADTDTPIFCCQSNTIPIRYRFFDTLQERTWRRVTDRSKVPDAAAATNNSGAPRTRCSAAADVFDLSWTVKHSNYQ